MKHLLRNILCVVLPLLLVAPLTVSANEETSTDDYYHGELNIKNIWTNRSGGADEQYTSHRIPGIVVTKKNTVIIYCEARTGDNSYSLAKGNDWCMMDIFIQRSTDGGETFGDPIYIARGTKEFATCNNPVLIVGNDNTLHMLYCRNYSINGGGLWYRKSVDDGLSWSEEIEITKFAESVPHDCFAFGPTHGICTDSGVLMAPVWLVPSGEGRDGITSHGPSKTYVFYSKDNGETWALSDVCSGNSNETDIAETSDGKIILNSRASPRKITTSKDGISNWTTTYSDEALIDPGCCAGLVSVDIDGLPYAHLFSNCANKSSRTMVTVKCSFDDCVTWEKSLVLSELDGGYSDIAVDQNGRVYVLYEINYGVKVRLARFSFVDEFCQDELKTTNQTTFSIDAQTATNVVTSAVNLSTTQNSDSVCFTATDTKKHLVGMDLTSLSQNINLTDYEAVILNLKITSSSKDLCEFGVYFTGGRVKETENQCYVQSNCACDGEWHQVIFNIQKAKGMLRSLQLEPFTVDWTCDVGDTIEISSIQFCKTMEEADAIVNPKPAETTNQQETKAPQTSEESKASSGCSSNLTPGFLLPLAIITASCFILRRKKDVSRRMK